MIPLVSQVSCVNEDITLGQFNLTVVSVRDTDYSSLSPH
jgi:hypothetical protein